MSVALSATAAVALDWLLSEPARCHPLVGFGRLADGIERRLNRVAVRQRAGCVCRQRATEHRAEAVL